MSTLTLCCAGSERATYRISDLTRVRGGWVTAGRWQARCGRLADLPSQLHG